MALATAYEYDFPALFRDWATIAERVHQWRLQRSPLIEAMMQVRERYDGEWILPEMGVDSKPLIPTIIADGIDNLALRAGSVYPSTFSPAINQGSAPSRQRALRRAKAFSYTWYKSEWQLESRRAMRHLAGYGTSAMVVIPDFREHCPRVIVRDPLHTIPEPRAPEDRSQPEACAFVYGKSVEWIRRRYPEAAGHLGDNPRAATTIWDLVEFIDCHATWIGLLGPRDETGYLDPRDARHLRPFPLRRWENRAGMCTVAVPEMVTMSKVSARVARITGHVDLMARLMALDVMAAEKHLVPDRYMIGRTGQTPELVGGIWQDGRTGKVNVILDAEQVGEMRGQPDPNVKLTMDRLERNARTSSGQVPQMIGESYGSQRSGRQIDAILGAAVDPQIQELHELFQARMVQVNEIIAETYKGYWPEHRYEVFSGWATDMTHVQFKPSEIFTETTANVVSYPIPGADAQSLTIAIAQLVGAGLISKQHGQILHPWIPNPEQMNQQLFAEALDEAMKLSLLTRSQDPTGGVTPKDLAATKRAILAGKSIEDAIDEADRLAQERAASIAPPAPEGMAVAPEAMPGLGMPGEGGEMQLPPEVPPPRPAVDNVRDLVLALAQPAQTVA